MYDGPETMSPDECRYVGDVLQMFDMMQVAFRNGQAAGVTPKRLNFPGFDGNNETKFMAYAQYMRKKQGRWKPTTLLKKLSSKRSNDERVRASKCIKVPGWTIDPCLSRVHSPQ